MTDVTALIEQALEASGTAVAVVARPERGAEAVIRHVNGPFAHVMSYPPSDMEGMSLGALKTRVPDPSHWAALLAALSANIPVELDAAFRARAGEIWLRLQVTFVAGEAAWARHAILIARDVTESRLAAAREETSRRLLAAIFSRISAPVVLVTATGEITMGNPAMYHLVGYLPDVLKGTRVQDLTAPEYAEAAQAAREKQLSDGERYEMRIETLAKGGTRIPVRLTSMLLRDEDRRLRVVTLIPETAPAIVLPPSTVLAARDRGELRAVSLGAFQAAFGGEWDRVATRAMQLAESIIRRRLRPDDLVSRSDDHSFILWFSSTSQGRNEDVLSGVVREIRLKFLTEFGEEAAAHVSAVMVAGHKPSDPVRVEQAPPARREPGGAGPLPVEPTPRDRTGRLGSGWASS